MANMQTGYVPQYVEAGGVQIASRDGGESGLATGISNVASSLMDTIGKNYRDDAKEQAALDKEQRMEMFKLKQADIKDLRKKEEEKLAASQHQKAWGLVAEYRKAYSTVELEEETSASAILKQQDDLISSFLSDVSSKLDLSAMAGPDGQGIRSFIESGIKEIKSASDLEKINIPGGHLRFINPYTKQVTDIRAPKTLDEAVEEQKDILKIYAPGLAIELDNDQLAAKGDPVKLKEAFDKNKPFLKVIDTHLETLRLLAEENANLDNLIKIGQKDKSAKEKKLSDDLIRIQTGLRNSVDKVGDEVIQEIRMKKRMGLVVDGLKAAEEFERKIRKTLPQDELIDKDVYSQMMDMIKATSDVIRSEDSKTETENESALLEAQRKRAAGLAFTRLTPDQQFIYSNASVLKLVGDVYLNQQMLGKDFYGESFTSFYNAMQTNYKESERNIKEFKSKWSKITSSSSTAPEIVKLDDNTRQAVETQTRPQINNLVGAYNILTNKPGAQDVWDKTINIAREVDLLGQVLETETGRAYFAENLEDTQKLFDLILYLKQKKPELNTSINASYKSTGRNVEELLLKILGGE